MFFSIVNTTVVHSSQLVESVGAGLWLQRNWGYRVPTVIFNFSSKAQRVGTSNSHIVYESTVAGGTEGSRAGGVLHPPSTPA